MILERTGYEVRCDSCGRISEPVYIGCLTNKLETGRLESAGWRIGENDLCPECAGLKEGEK